MQVSSKMQKDHQVPTADDGDTIQQLNALRTVDRQARLRALLPLINELTRQGVSQMRILDVLARAEINLKPASLRQALYRWRQRQRQRPDQPASPSNKYSTQLVPDSPNLPATPSPAPLAGIHSKADLKRLRDSSDHIDLNALAELGRMK